MRTAPTRLRAGRPGGRLGGRSDRGGPVDAGGEGRSNKLTNDASFLRNLQFFGGLVLGRIKTLQNTMRLTAFCKLYKIRILLHRCNLKILAKNRFEKSAIFVKIQQFFLQMLHNLKNVAKFEISKKSAR